MADIYDTLTDHGYTGHDHDALAAAWLDIQSAMDWLDTADEPLATHWTRALRTVQAEIEESEAVPPRLRRAQKVASSLPI